jgi:hypothetical protein
MKLSIYSTAFNAVKNNFDFKGALDNWFYYADEVCISVNKSEDDTFEQIYEYGKQKNYSLVINRTSFDYNDPFCYGKIENSALQSCSGDILIQQNLDERWAGDKTRLLELCGDLHETSAYKALFVPTIDLYGSLLDYLNIGQKWYIHQRGLSRGAVNFGIKQDGKPDYNKTSTDELIDNNRNLVPTCVLLSPLDIDNLREYAKAGWPFTFHLGYLDFKDRIERAKWWKEFWEKATGGDKNTHPTDIKELLARKATPHLLDLWPSL